LKITVIQPVFVALVKRRAIRPVQMGRTNDSVANYCA